MFFCQSVFIFAVCVHLFVYVCVLGVNIFEDTSNFIFRSFVNFSILFHVLSHIVFTRMYVCKKVFI